ncbi:hypothetical protein [Bacillus subtilis]|uniref:hypothetical protein n=1 Tax=Bacillus subtilis TaxID=1423 RepID=UPI00397741E9
MVRIVKRRVGGCASVTGRLGSTFRLISKTQAQKDPRRVGGSLVLIAFGSRLLYIYPQSGRV